MTCEKLMCLECMKSSNKNICPNEQCQEEDEGIEKVCKFIERHILRLWFKCQHKKCE